MLDLETKINIDKMLSDGVFKGRKGLSEKLVKEVLDYEKRRDQNIFILKAFTGFGKSTIAFNFILANSGGISVMFNSSLALNKQVFNRLIGKDDGDIVLSEMPYLKLNQVAVISSEEPFNIKVQVEKLLKSDKLSKIKAILMTYQSLVVLNKNYPNLFENFVLKCNLLFSDEAHNSLGREIVSAFNSLYQIKKENNSLYEHILMTATMVNTRTGVESIYGKIDHNITFGRGLDDNLIMSPKNINVGGYNGVAYIGRKTDDLSSLGKKDESSPLEHIYIKKKEENNVIEQDTFYNKFLYEEIIEKYISSLKENNLYLPSKAFVSTISQAVFLVDKFKKLSKKLGVNIRIKLSVSSSSHPDNINIDDAKDLFMKNELDVLILVKRGSEGIDFPFLRGLLLFTFSYSPSLCIQRFGRIVRTINPQLSDLYKNKIPGYVDKIEENTLIFSPNYFSGVNSLSQGNNTILSIKDVLEEEEASEDTEDNEEKKHKYTKEIISAPFLHLLETKDIELRHLIKSYGVDSFLVKSFIKKEKQEKEKKEKERLGEIDNLKKLFINIYEINFNNNKNKFISGFLDLDIDISIKSKIKYLLNGKEYTGKNIFNLFIL